ncbi:MAG: hypothetical protein ABEJ98_05380 [Candidatus Nanohaloarchaea archaeon]
MSSKGITPVIATVLLILVSVAATVSAFTFLTSIQQQARHSWEQKFNEQQLASKSEIGIEFMYNKSTYFVMSVRNTGSITVPVKEKGNRLWDLYINGRPVNGDASSWSLTGSKKSDRQVLLDPQETIVVNTTAKFPAEGKSKSVKIAGPYEISASAVCYNSGGSSC